MSDVVDLQKFKDANVELEKSYSLQLTEKELYLIARNITKMFRKKHNGKHEHPKEETFHMMLICDKFKKALEGKEFTLVPKQRLPI